MPTQFYQLSVATIRYETNDTVRIGFKIPVAQKEIFRFDPGQYLTISLTIEGKTVRRAYSICSATHESIISFLVKRVDKGLVSNYLNDHIQIGDKINVLPPNGHFKMQIQTEKKNKYVFLGAGSGITPLMSMIESVLESEAHSNCHLIYGSRDEPNIIFKSKLDRLQLVYQDRFNVHYVLSQAKSTWLGLRGRIDETLLKNCLPENKASVNAYFICGPNAMIESTYDNVLKLGVGKEKVHREYFSAPLPKVDENAVVLKRENIAAKVKIILEQKEYTLRIDDDTDIVHALLQKNIEPPYSCLSGTCSTCKAKLLKGEVQMDVSIGIEDDEKAAGYILTCQAHPLTEDILVDFDQ